MLIVEVVLEAQQTCVCGELMRESIDWGNHTRKQVEELTASTQEEVAERIGNLEKIGTIKLQWQCSHCGFTCSFRPFRAALTLGLSSNGEELLVGRTMLPHSVRVL